MSYDQFLFSRSSPFTGLADPRSFYRSPQYGEALATLRYGIEARKGFMLFTGAAGTGKSALLHELTRELSANVTCVLIANPHLGFTEIIRAILLPLQAEPESTEEPALLRQCLNLLRSQFESGRIIALAFDDAHHISEKVVEQVAHSFIRAGPEAPRQHLAQIILAGRPELLRPPLRSLAAPAPLECQLRPLSEKEVSEYIEHRLRAADLPVDLFEPAATQSIAAYSGGRLREVNALGDRAFRSADFSLRRRISLEIIEAAAKDLDLWQPQWVRKESSEKVFTIPDERDDLAAFRFTNDTADAVGQTFFNINDDKNRERRFSRSGRTGKTLQILAIVLLLGIASAWLQGEPARKYLTQWGVTLEKIIASDRQFPADAKNESVPSPSATEELVSSIPMPSTHEPQPEDASRKTGDPSAVETEQSVELPAPAQEEIPSVKTSTPPPQKAPDRTVGRREISPREGTDQQKRELATQVSKAIENRAIPGIGVSVIDGTAYLNGRVATERQRTAAERAAHSVPDVREVRNRITIE